MSVLVGVMYEVGGIERWLLSTCVKCNRLTEIDLFLVCNPESFELEQRAEAKEERK